MKFSLYKELNINIDNKVKTIIALNESKNLSKEEGLTLKLLNNDKKFEDIKMNETNYLNKRKLHLKEKILKASQTDFSSNLNETTKQQYIHTEVGELYNIKNNANSISNIKTDLNSINRPKINLRKNIFNKEIKHNNPALKSNNDISINSSDRILKVNKEPIGAKLNLNNSEKKPQKSNNIILPKLKIKNKQNYAPNFNNRNSVETFATISTQQDYNKIEEKNKSRVFKNKYKSNEGLKLNVSPKFQKRLNAIYHQSKETVKQLKNIKLSHLNTDDLEEYQNKLICTLKDSISKDNLRILLNKFKDILNLSSSNEKSSFERYLSQKAMQNQLRPYFSECFVSKIKIKKKFNSMNNF